MKRTYEACQFKTLKKFVKEIPPNQKQRKSCVAVLIDEAMIVIISQHIGPVFFCRI